MFRHLSLSLLIYILTISTVIAQDYSNKGLMEIKELSEAKRLGWIKMFDDAVQAHTFSALVAARRDNELFLDKNISAMRRMYAEGDGRGLLNSVANYLQIERQFVKDVMVPAESLTAANTDGIQSIYDKISAFAEKEKPFLVDINNAVLLEPDAGPATPSSPAPEADEEEEMEEMRGSIVEERKKKSKSKLPHEQSGKEKRKSKTKDRDEE